MKTIFLISLLLLLGVGAFGQCCQFGSVPTPPMSSTVWMPDHSMHATRHALGAEYNLQEIGGVTMAQGEMPAWEIFRPVDETPLGDAARACRKEHAAAEKARIVWEQVGN